MLAVPLAAALPQGCRASGNAPTKPTRSPATTRSATSQQADAPPLLNGFTEGAYLADRVGRLKFNPMGPYPYFYCFERGHLTEIELLPDRNLMAIEQAAFWNPRQLFSISGHITNYQGRDYLLVERVTRVLASSRPEAAAASSTQPSP